ncbi:MAG: putative DNA base hypermodification protein [Nanoarchaeales archaeon]
MKIDLAKIPKKALNYLKEIPSINNFLAYEIWTDLTYFNFFKQGWSDNDFVYVGPGARWGLNIMMGKDTKNFLIPPENYSNLIYILRDMMPKTLEELGLKEEWLKIAYRGAYSNVPFLSLRV